MARERVVISWRPSTAFVDCQLSSVDRAVVRVPPRLEGSATYLTARSELVGGLEPLSSIAHVARLLARHRSSLCDAPTPFKPHPRCNLILRPCIRSTTRHVCRVVRARYNNDIKRVSGASTPMCVCVIRSRGSGEGAQRMDDWACRRSLGTWRPLAAFVPVPSPPVARSVDRAVTRAPPPSRGRPWAAFVDRPPSPAR